jgi:hypothetical protein
MEFFETWLWKSIPVTSLFLLYVAVVSAIVALVVSTVFHQFYFKRLYAKPESSDVSYSWLRILVPALVLALIGGMSGQLGGGSRDSVVGDLIPAFFTLAGGYGAYLLGNEKVKSPFLVPNGLSFVFAFFILYNLAAVWRQETELERFCLELFANPDFDNAMLMGYRSGTFAEYCKPIFD